MQPVSSKNLQQTAYTLVIRVHRLTFRIFVSDASLSSVLAAVTTGAATIVAGTIGAGAAETVSKS